MPRVLEPITPRRCAGRRLALFALLGPLQSAPATAQSCVALCARSTASPQVAQHTVARPPGLGFGASVGLNRFGGPANGPLRDAIGYEVFVGGATTSGLALHAGSSFGGHGVTGDAAPWKFVNAFLEPRWMALGISPAWAPFVAGRFARVWERVVGRNYSFNGSGFAWGGGGGAVIRLAPQIALEAGVLLGRARFGAYTFRGEYAWKSCLDNLESGTGLPESLERCGASRSLGGVVRLCYPPYYTEATSSCVPPDIPYEDTGRTGSWFRSWLGVHFSLASSLR
ncbi:MAG: hypothetical protein L0271_06160 [Gemmatimonadetes bacterium]|nr:hypothetical protein [Gemmatimonadota bacterium]